MVACTTGIDRLHLLLTLLSGGVWGIVWLYCRLFAPVCACCQCGRRLSRRAMRAGTQPLLETPWPNEPSALKYTEFNSLLVARNLVYYVPTSARYRHT
jgi:hypothetical protein